MKEIKISINQFITIENAFVEVLRNTSDYDMIHLQLILREVDGNLSFKIGLDN
jgi:hypothetical protein